jgi:hypothetical protein
MGFKELRPAQGAARLTVGDMRVIGLGLIDPAVTDRGLTGMPARMRFIKCGYTPPTASAALAHAQHSYPIGGEGMIQALLVTLRELSVTRPTSAARHPNAVGSPTILATNPIAAGPTRMPA